MDVPNLITGTLCRLDTTNTSCYSRILFNPQYFSVAAAFVSVRLLAYMICNRICKKESYSLSNCMYLAIYNLTCAWYQPEIWSLCTPNIALSLNVILRQMVKHTVSYDSSNLEI